MFQRTNITNQTDFAQEVEKHQTTTEGDTAERFEIIHRTLSTTTEKN